MLGLELLADEGEYVRVGNADGWHMGIEAAPDPAAIDGCPGVELVIRVPNVDAAYQRLVGAGFEFETAPADMPWGARRAWLSDPSGYRLSIYSASDQP